MATGILLINLGTPKSPSVKDVRAFLAEFLSDPYVIDLPAPLRYFILYGFILPFRPKKSAAAYQKIWTPAGSPIAVHSKQLCTALAKQLGPDYLVKGAMRYGEASIFNGLKALQGCDTIIALPLFPQYSLAATETCLQQIDAAANKLNIQPKINTIRDFYNHPSFVKPQGKLIHDFLLQNTAVQKIVFSFHGLPIRQIKKVEKNNRPCPGKTACPTINANNRWCYRAQCYATARAIAALLPEKYADYCVSFQSRLGKNPWIKPATDEVLPQLRQQGITRIAIACPSFVADCLETLEEIAIEAKQQWLALGGQDLQLIPCLNADAYWVEQLAAWLSAATPLDAS